MSILQAYEANLLRDLDEGEGVSLDAMIELHLARDLSAKAIGWSMATERYHWLNLYEIKEKKSLSFGCPAVPSRSL